MRWLILLLSLYNGAALAGGKLGTPAFQGLLGGTLAGKDPSAWGAAAGFLPAIVYIEYLPRAGILGSGCTGTLVQPWPGEPAGKWVLTAAHCVRGVPEASGAYRVYASQIYSEVERPFESGGLARYREWARANQATARIKLVTKIKNVYARRSTLEGMRRYHDQQAAMPVALMAEDFALLELEEPLQGLALASRTLPMARFRASFREFFLSGYGLEDSRRAVETNLRYGRLHESQRFLPELTDFPANSPNAARQNEILASWRRAGLLAVAAGEAGKPMLCSGDSGGSLLGHGRDAFTILGVASSAIGTREVNCGNFSLYAPLPADWRAFIADPGVSRVAIP